MMRQHLSTLAVVVVAAVCSALLAGPSAAKAGARQAAGAHAAASGGVWGKAQKVPGLAALGQPHDAEVYSVSCGSAGSCSAGGYYTDNSGNRQAFVVDKSSGIWRKAEEVPGSGALNTGREAYVDSVSCASARNCSAGGSFRPRSGTEPAFVAGETAGRWGDAEKLLPHSDFVGISLSCARPGDCSAGGSYGAGDCACSDPFVANETSGTWGQEQELPGMGALNGGGYGQVDSVSCGSAGNCSASGFYTTFLSVQQAFIASETNGIWGKARKVPGTAALNTGGFAEATSVSCGSAGNCSAGGSYSDGNNDHAFVIAETNGIWGKAQVVPGLAALSQGLSTGIDSVSCGSAGNCSAGGSYLDSSDYPVAFVVNET